MHYLKKK